MLTGFFFFISIVGFPLLGRKEGNVLFNNAHNTFYLQLYGVRHMIKYHTDSERGNLLPPHGLLFPINSKGSFICTICRIAYTTAFFTPVVEHWLEWEITQWVHPTKDRSDNPSHHPLNMSLSSYVISIIVSSWRYGLDKYITSLFL